jgi:hypothetical protein
MASSSERKFDSVLLSLFKDRTHDLRSKVRATPRPVPKFTRRRILKAIHELQALAEDVLLKTKRSKEILCSYDHKKQWHPKRGKGFGRPAKRASFKR